ncbi:WD40-repeat-containing domain protein, partial [Mycena latifolia]
SGAALGEPLQGHTGQVWSVAFSSDGKKIVSGSSDHTVRIWDAESGAAVKEPLQGHTDWVRSVAFSPNGKRIVSSSNDHTVRIWDADSFVNGACPLGSSTTASGCHLLNFLHVKSPYAPMCWQIHSGWVSCIPSELLFWVPTSLRIGLWSPHNTQVIGREQTKLSY